MCAFNREVATTLFALLQSAASSHLPQAEEALAAVLALEGARDLGARRQREEVEEREAGDLGVERSKLGAFGPASRQ